MEIWADVPILQFRDRYLISDRGRIQSKWNKNIMSPTQKGGYYRICLSKERVRRDIGVHILVAMAFINNPNKLPIVNHKNGDKADNISANLEWVSRKDNARQALETGLTIPKTTPVMQYELDGITLVAEYNSMKSAKEKTGISGICDVCKGRKPSAGNFIWRYKNEKDGEVVESSEVKGLDIPDWPFYKAIREGKIYSERARKYLKPNESSTYYSITLNRKGETKEASIHLLIARLFIPNPKDLPCVNHKNGNKRDNHVDNLEWVSRSENVIHAINVLECNRSGKAVVQFDMDRKYKAKYDSMVNAAAASKIDTRLINRVCRNGRKSTGNFIWRYATDCHKDADGTYYIASKILFE